MNSKSKNHVPENPVYVTAMSGDVPENVTHADPCAASGTTSGNGLRTTPGAAPGTTSGNGLRSTSGAASETISGAASETISGAASETISGAASETISGAASETISGAASRTTPGTGLESAAGPVTIPMYNDYLFRALLQRNNRVLKGLICALLHLDVDQVLTVIITNPIELGDMIDNRYFFLDVKVLMDNQTLINLEMQVVNEHNWTDRSLSYLCRSFDHLGHDQDYRYAKPTIQIGLLNFTLFPGNPEFYATYQFLNVKNHMLYSDKLRLSVVDLTRTDLATEEDRSYHIDYWASLFKSTTWEEIKMLAQKDDVINEASSTIYQLTQEEKIRLQCEAREDYYRRQNYVEKEFARKDAALAEKDTIIAEKEAALAEKDAEIAQLNKLLLEKSSLSHGNG